MLNNFLLKTRTTVLRNDDAFTTHTQHLEESRNSSHPHLVFQFCKRVPEVMRDWRIWLRNALETHVRIWQVFIHSVNNWRERLIGGTEEHSDQMQRLFLLKVLFFSNPGGLLISFSQLMTGKTHDSPLRLPSYLPFVGSISYAAKRIHGVWQVSYPGTTTNPTHVNCLKLSRPFTELQATISSTWFLLISPMPPSQQLKKTLSRTPNLVFLQCCQL